MQCGFDLLSYKMGLDMREFVYVSSGKLAQFAEDLPRSRWRSSVAKVEVKLPFAGLSLEGAASQSSNALEHSRRLAAVSAHLGTSASWYESEGVIGGQWVLFDVPLVYALSGPLVLFCDTLNPRELDQTRLLLHGSVSSLMQDAREEAAGAGAALPSGASSAAFVRDLEAAFLSLNFVDEPVNEPPMLPADPTAQLRRSVARVISALDANYPPITAGWMTGLARVSAAFPALDAVSASADVVGGAIESAPGRIIVASPLYVERVPVPTY